VLVDPVCALSDLRRCGHAFPLRARPGDDLERPGHPEIALDLVRPAGRFPAGVLSEVVNDDGSVARKDDLRRLAEI